MSYLNRAHQLSLHALRVNDHAVRVDHARAAVDAWVQVFVHAGVPQAQAHRVLQNAVFPWGCDYSDRRALTDLAVFRQAQVANWLNLG